MNKSINILDKEYLQWVKDLCGRYRQSQIKAAVKVNVEQLKFNWLLGRDIVELHVEERWGESVITRLSKDLREAIPMRLVCQRAYYFSIYNTDKWEPVYQNMGKKSVETAKASYEEALKRYGSDNRKEIVGDNPLDINDTHYGNNVLLTSDAATGVMKAGVIAAKRDNGIGSNGIADNAEIMTLRIHPGEGEPYLKDMALAIRYAVNHGADVIVLPEQNSIYPKEQKQWVSEALKEAEKKGALVIVPVWDLSMDMDKEEFFPNRKMNKEGELTNFMVVASSDKNGNPVLNTNYGATALDIYAPGTDIYSSYMGDTYQKGTGEGMASATVAGVAALVKSYFPKLTGSQIRDILLKSVTSRKGIEVEKGIRVNDSPSQDLFLFDDLCISGGIVNAYQAILEAEKVSK
mgnify:CR=1 FL=1